MFVPAKGLIAPSNLFQDFGCEYAARDTATLQDRPIETEPEVVVVVISAKGLEPVPFRESKNINSDGQKGRWTP